MGMLTEKGQKRYALATGKQCVAICDEKNCGRLIPVNELYIVRKWKPRKDGLTFLGLRPSKIRCKTCQERINPRYIAKVKIVKHNKPLKKVIERLFTKFPKTRLETKSLVLKLKSKTKFAKTKRVDFTVALRLLKKEKFLQYKDKVWKLYKN